MKNRKGNTAPEGVILNSYIQPSPSDLGQPAQVVQDGWIAYLPSGKHARASFESEGRGFLKGHRVFHLKSR